MRALVDAVNRSDLHVVGRLMTREELLRCLRTRFLVGERRRRDPAIADEVIEAPVIVTGPGPLGHDDPVRVAGPRSRFAHAHGHGRDPPGACPTARGDDERRAMTEAEQELWADVQPEFAAIHELRSDLPVECITICAPSFAGSHWSMVLTDQGAWQPDVTADLAFHRALLQTVQHGRPRRRWLLKTPGYVFMLDDLLAAYPDACIVLTHRDPARTMPSTVSTAAMVRWLRTDSSTSTSSRR